MANAQLSRLCGQLPDNWALCGFLNNYEAEVLVAQTLHACHINLNERGEAFSFRGNGVFVADGLVDNGKAYRRLLDEGYFEEQQRDSANVSPPSDARVDEYGQVTVIVMTKKLFDSLDRFIERRGDGPRYADED